jgi:hypothetical protein
VAAILALGAVAVAAVAATTALTHPSDFGGVQTAHAGVGHLVRHEEAAVGLCPWREPDRDRQRFFPTATDVREETLILSGKRPEIARQLGRPATGEENALKVYRILRRQQVLGSVVARRVKGDSGVIELLLAVGADGAVIGAKLQRMREPDAVATALQSPAWLGAFAGKTRDADWRLGAAVPEVPAPARASATAVLNAARTLLVLLATADNARLSAAAHPSAAARP